MNVSELTSSAISYALSNGLCHGEIINEKQYHTHMPISLLPFPISNEKKNLGEKLNQLFAELIVQICHKPEWLFEQLKEVTDDYTIHLIQIAKEVIQEPTYQPIIMGLLRSDYMINKEDSALLQIELNTISCSFLGVEEKLTKLHQFLFSSNPDTIDAIASFMGVSVEDIHKYIQDIDFNHTIETTCANLASAVNVYNTLYNIGNTGNTGNTSILIVNQENENNNVDQFLLSIFLLEHYHIHCIYQTHKQLQQSMTVIKGCLQVHNREIAVVYYRSGYTPSDYPSEAEWNVRKTIELSRAIKCPNIILHLIGCKKIQQQLGMSGVLETLFDHDSTKVQELRQCFAPMYPAISVVYEAQLKPVLEDVLNNPLNYVLKPQREGGGFNIWGDDIVKTLEKGDRNELASLIVMKRIFPEEYNAYHVKDSQAILRPSLSEIGFYSSILFDSAAQKMIKRQDLGILVRTKVSDSFEGGVSAGFAVLNSPIIISTNKN